MMILLDGQLIRYPCGELWSKGYVCVCGTDHSVEERCADCYHRHRWNTGKCYGLPGERKPCPCQNILKVPRNEIKVARP